MDKQGDKMNLKHYYVTLVVTDEDDKVIELKNEPFLIKKSTGFPFTVGSNQFFAQHTHDEIDHNEAYDNGTETAEKALMDAIGRYIEEE